MNKRQLNMQRYNALRSARVTAMLKMLRAIDHGASELEYLTGEDDSYLLEDQLNTYRAQKIACYFGINISKGKLLEFAKPDDHIYQWSAKNVMSYIKTHHDAFLNYREWYEQPEIRTVNKKFDELEKSLKN